MAVKIYISGNALIVEDESSGDILKDDLKDRVYYDSKLLKDNSVIQLVVYDSIKNVYTSWFSSNLSDAKNSSGDVFTKSTFRTFCNYNLGTLQQLSSISSSKFILVNSVTDLPIPSSGVITLLSGTSYYFTTQVDLLGDKLGTNGVVSILSSSPEIGIITSTGLSSAEYLLTSVYTVALNNIGLDNVKCLNLDASTQPNQTVDWFGVNFYDCTTEIGLIKSYGNVIMNTIGFLNSGNLTLDGTIGTVGIVNTLFENAPALTSIIVPATATITRRIRVSNSSFVSLSGERALDVSTSATIDNEGYILDTVNFSGGGTYLAGVQDTDNKARFFECRGINNTASVGHYYMQGNVTSTVISTSGTFVKIAGSTSSGALVEQFDVTTTSNRAVYTGGLTQFFEVKHIASTLSGNNKLIQLRNSKNGVTSVQSQAESTTSGNNKAENIVSQDIVQLSTNDYIEAFVTNASDTTNITATNLTTIIKRLT